MKKEIDSKLVGELYGAASQLCSTAKIVEDVWFKEAPSSMATSITALRLLSLLGKRYDLMKAAQLVMENNHLKYTDDEDKSGDWYSRSAPADDSWTISGVDVKGKYYYCMKDDNGKVRKWLNFPKVELNVEELRKG